MRTQVDITLNQLRCIVKNESTDDEPYMWVFSAKADGTNVVKDPNTNTNRLISSIVVKGIGSSHSNLGSTMPAAIPSAMSTISELLHPIEVTIKGETVRFPGMVLFVATVMEEDLSGDDAAEEAREDVAALVGTKFNQFFNRPDLIQLIIAKATAESNVPDSQLNAKHFTKAFLSLLEEFRKEIKVTATFFVDSALGKGRSFFLSGGNLDPDDYVGSGVMLIEQSTAENKAFDEIIDDADDEGQYALTGNITGTVLRSQFIRSGTVSRTEGPQGSHTFSADEKRLCIAPGQRIEWLTELQTEQEDLTYPEVFAPLESEWKIQGTVLDFGSGNFINVDFDEMDCQFPEFNPSYLEQPISKGVKKKVKLQIKRVIEKGIEGLQLTNRPEDGNYHVTVQVFAKVGASRLALTHNTIAFEGQRIASPFYDKYRKCIGKYTSISDRFAISTRVGPKGPFAPSVSGRIRWYEQQIHIAESLKAGGKLSAAEVEHVKTVMKKRLSL